MTISATAVLMALTSLSGGAVAVNVEPPEAAGQGVDPALRAWLVQRFLEEGVDVTGDPGSAAAVATLQGSRRASLWVGVGDDRARVDAGEPAVMRLEVWHRVRTAAEIARQSEAANNATAWRRVSLQVDEGVPDARRDAVARALLGAGFVLSPEPDPRTATVCVAPHEGAGEFRVGSPNAQCSFGAMTIEDATLRRPGGVDPLVAWVERALAGPLPAPTDDERPPGLVDAAEFDLLHADPSIADATVERRSWSDRTAEARLGVDGGVMVRGAVDGTMRALLRLGMAPGPGGAVAVAVTPSQLGAVRVIDTVLTAGPDLSLRFGRDLGLDAMLALGAEIHSYRHDGGRGGNVDFYVSSPVAFSWRMGPAARMHLVVEPGFSRARREHVDPNSVDWKRTAWSVRAGLGVSYGWGIL